MPPVARPPTAPPAAPEAPRGRGADGAPSGAAPAGPDAAGASSNPADGTTPDGGGAFALLMDMPVPPPPAPVPPPPADAAAGGPRTIGVDAPRDGSGAATLPAQLLAMLGLQRVGGSHDGGSPAAPPARQVDVALAPAPDGMPPRAPVAAAHALPPATASTAPLAGAALPIAPVAFAMPRTATPDIEPAATASVASAPVDATPLPIAPPALSAPGEPPRPQPATLPLPLAQPADPGAGFDDGIGANLAWMAERRIGHAELRLNPEHLGPVEVRMRLEGDRVHAEFHSAQADVRQALEATLPRLRDLLGQHGLQLAQADVGARQQHEARQGGSGRGEGASPDADGTLATGDRPAPGPARTVRGLLDEYA
ncbi:flagellar hook-length control protein FliK [Luteimonas pelagia]